MNCEERGNKMATQAMPPPPSDDFWASFSEKPVDLWEKWRIYEKKYWGFEANSQVASLGGTLADFP